MAIISGFVKGGSKNIWKQIYFGGILRLFMCLLSPNKGLYAQTEARDLLVNQLIQIYLQYISHTNSCFIAS